MTNTTDISQLEIRWPDAILERIRAARGRLERAGEALRALSLDERLRSTARVLEDWTAPDSPWRRELVTAFAADSPFHENTVREGLEAALRAWNPDAFVECARRELSMVMQSKDLVLSPFAWTAVLAGGAVPMPTMLNVLVPLVLGSPVLLRETSSDRTTAGLLKRSLEARNETLARAFEYLTFSADDNHGIYDTYTTTAFDALLEAPCIVATGSDETIRSLSARISPNQRFLAYGHRFSIGVLGPAFESDAGALRQVAEGFALDVARWDQTGCLSPVVVYLVGVEPSAGMAFATAISTALEKISGPLPRGEISTAVAASHASERAEARMRQGSRQTAFMTMLFEGDDYTVVLESDARPRPAPLHRFLRLMPVASPDELERALGPFVGQLSNVATAGFSPDEAGELRRRLLRFGASRFTEPGRLQTPPVDWPHDGMPLLTPIVRLTQSN